MRGVTVAEPAGLSAMVVDWVEVQFSLEQHLVVQHCQRDPSVEMKHYSLPDDVEKKKKMQMPLLMMRIYHQRNLIVVAKRNHP